MPVESCSKKWLGLALFLTAVSMSQSRADDKPRALITKICADDETTGVQDTLQSVELPIGNIHVEATGFDPNQPVELFVDNKLVATQEKHESGKVTFTTLLPLLDHYTLTARQPELSSQDVTVTTTSPMPPKIILKDEQNKLINPEHGIAKTERCFIVSFARVQPYDRVKLFLNGELQDTFCVHDTNEIKHRVVLPKADLYKLSAKLSRFNLTSAKSKTIHVYTNQQLPKHETPTTIVRPFEFNFPHQPIVKTLVAVSNSAELPSGKWEYHSDTLEEVDDDETSVNENEEKKDTAGNQRANQANTRTAVGPEAERELVSHCDEDESSAQENDDSVAAKCNAKNKQDKKPMEVSVYEFWDPAEFYITHFGPDGVAHDDPALLIFEGMRIVFEPSGRYEIRFTTSATRRPVSMQLQFGLVKSSDGSGFRTLMTLPRIEVPFSVKTEDQVVAPSNIKHVGYSPSVKDCYHILKEISDKRCSGCPPNDSEWTIQRHGKAKFGFGAAAL